MDDFTFVMYLALMVSPTLTSNIDLIDLAKEILFYNKSWTNAICTICDWYNYHNVRGVGCGPQCLQLHSVAGVVAGSVSVFPEVNVKVDGAVEGGQQMTGTCHVWQPTGPHQLRLKIVLIMVELCRIYLVLPDYHQFGPIPKCLESISQHDTRWKLQITQIKYFIQMLEINLTKCSCLSTTKV